MIIEIVKWIYITLSVVGALASIALIGEDRKPYTKTYAVVSVITSALFIWFIFSV